MYYQSRTNDRTINQTNAVVKTLFHKIIPFIHKNSLEIGSQLVLCE